MPSEFVKRAMPKIPTDDQKKAEHEIAKLRDEINSIHAEMFLLIRRRFDIVKKIWQIKSNHQINTIDTRREVELVSMFDNQYKNKSEQKSIQQVFKVIIDESKKYIQVSTDEGQ